MDDEKTVAETGTGEEQKPLLMTKKEFWIRMSLWVLFCVIVPVGFLSWRYGLFTHTHTEESDGYAITGGGIMAIIVVGVFFLSLLRELRRGLPYWSMGRQCIEGYARLVPLLCLILVLDVVKTNIAYLEQTLIVFLVSEAVAVPINPMRKWQKQNHIDYEENMIVHALKRVFPGKSGK